MPDKTQSPTLLTPTLGFEHRSIAHHNLPVAALYEEAVTRGEGMICADGPLLIRTGRYTGRSPKDRFIVRDEETESRVEWGSVNLPIDPARFDALHRRMTEYLEEREVFVVDARVGADERYRLPIRVISERASGALFAKIMFIDDGAVGPRNDPEPRFTVLHAPGLQADPERDGTRSEVFILVNFTAGLVLIGGTEYAGEIKKSIFSVMNYLLPAEGVLPMHCSANYGADRGDVALFFGLSGTGKTTLSADSSRTLIGDDEHGWTEEGVFNFEGGCYAKAIGLTEEREPEIYATTRMFGTLLENVVMDPETRRLDFADTSLTENTRVAYPITHIENMDPAGKAGHPRHIFMLTADAFGVLPPIAKLSPEQAMYHFLSGYTAKVAGTERGVTEPQAAFSTCFGAPFMPRPPRVYADLLGALIERHGARVWLVNTGWTGGPYGEGERISLRYTRAMLDAAMRGALDDVPTDTDPVFGLGVPRGVPGVPDEVMKPRSTWRDPGAYDAKARELADMFRQNFEQHRHAVSPAVAAAGPKGGS
jgi:phosphoenolpyruvate carboxykinase (ATP)